MNSKPLPRLGLDRNYTFESHERKPSPTGRARLFGRRHHLDPDDVQQADYRLAPLPPVRQEDIDGGSAQNHQIGVRDIEHLSAGHVQTQQGSRLFVSQGTA